jgi:uroporphyrinogen-III synthase
MRILVTRPEPDNVRTAAALRARGHAVILAPLMQIEPLAPDLGGGPFAAVVLTSANAARALARHPQRDVVLSLPVFAVGGATADAARDAGFRRIETAGGDAVDLVRVIAAQPMAASAPFLYLAGENRAADIADMLAAHGRQTRLVVIYRAVPCALSAIAARMLAAGEIDAVAHYSRRSALLFRDSVVAAGLGPLALAPLHVCFAEPIAEVLRIAGAERIQVIARPDEDLLLDLIGSSGVAAPSD